MVKYSNNQALCLMDYEGKRYLIDLESGLLKGRTSIFMWFFPKNVHCLNEHESAIIKDEKLFRGETAPIILMAGLGTLAYGFFGDTIGSLYINLSPIMYAVLIVLAILLGIVFDFIFKGKDQINVKQKLGEIKYERQMKIRFITKKDKFIYIVQSFALAIAGTAMFIGYGSFIILCRSNPIGLVIVFVGGWILFGTSKKIPKRYKIEFL